jgi:rhodanese-related sulfurtransferase
MSNMTIAHLVAEARERIDNLSPQSVLAELDDADVLLVDLRESEERVEHGTIPRSIHAPRGMIEFYADSAYHRAEFDPQRRIILYCASGGRSALAASTLECLGYTRVAHLAGGLRAWREADLPVQSAASP